MREWIRVEDRLPKTDDYVWVTIESNGNRIVTRTWYSYNLKRWDEFGCGIIAWMPIETKPEPYDPNKSSVSKDYITSDDTDEEAVEILIGKIHRENGKCDSVELADDFMNNSDSLDDTWMLRQILNLIHINSYKEK